MGAREPRVGAQYATAAGLPVRGIVREVRRRASVSCKGKGPEGEHSSAAILVEAEGLSGGEGLGRREGDRVVDVRRKLGLIFWPQDRHENNSRPKSYNQQTEVLGERLSSERLPG